MVLFYKTDKNKYFAVHSKLELGKDDKQKLSWMFSAALLDQNELKGSFVGPRKEMITPWSTNAVEIAQNMGISGIIRI